MAPLVAVVDDDVSVRKSLDRLIRSVRLEVETFASAEEFLKSAPPLKPDCLVLDVSLPGMSGLELLKHIKQKHREPPPVVMMITAYGDSDNYNSAMQLGADDFLTKPLEFSLLKEKLKAIH